MAISNSFEMLWSLNQYKAHFIESKQNSTSEYVAEVTYDEADYFHNGDCSLKLYVNKEVKDIQINKWIFPCTIKGKYHYPPQWKNTQSINIEFDCIDPNNNKQKVVIWDDEHWEPADFAELYLNTLYLISNSLNIEEYNALQSLKKDSFKAYSIKSGIKYMEQLLNAHNFITNYQTREYAQSEFINNIKQQLKEKFNQLKQSLIEIELI